MKLFALYIYAFFVVYSPNFFRNEIMNYMMPFIYWFIGLIAFNSNGKRWTISIFKDKRTKQIIIYSILALIAFDIRAVIAGARITDFANLRIVQSFSVIVSVVSFTYIINCLEDYNYTTAQKMQFILNVGMIQFAIILFMLIFPSFRINILNRFYMTNESRNYTYTLQKRVYGLMSNYTFSGSVFHGMLAFLAVFFGFRDDNKLYLYVPFMLLIVFLNSRVGLVLFVIATVGFLLYVLFTRGNLVSTYRPVIYLVLLGILAVTVLPIIWPKTYVFFSNGLTEMIDYARNGIASTERVSDIDILTTHMKTNFNIKTLIFGNGYRIRKYTDIPSGAVFTGQRTDIGFLNDMYMGGLIYMYLLIAPYYQLMKKNAGIRLSRALSFFLLLLMLVANLKGETFRSPDILGLVLFVEYALNDEQNLREGS